MAGQNTLFTRTMHDMAYNAVHDEVLVPQFFAFAILTFAGDADGNVGPIRKIFGPKTTMRVPQALAVDPIHNEIFVPGHDEDNRVLVFDRLADGDVAPLRVLETDREPARVAVDPVRNLLVVSGGPRLQIFDRTASGKDQPQWVINLPPRTGRTTLMAIDTNQGMIFSAVVAGTRHDPLDYIGVWSIYDKGEVAPRWTIGGPNGLLRDVCGVAIDPRNKNVIVSDKTLNGVLTFNVPEAF
jgi:DNA-binding beta-propeller fold protein YncE